MRNFRFAAEPFVGIGCLCQEIHGKSKNLSRKKATPFQFLTKKEEGKSYTENWYICCRKEGIKLGKMGEGDGSEKERQDNPCGDTGLWKAEAFNLCGFLPGAGREHEGRV